MITKAEERATDIFDRALRLFKLNSTSRKAQVIARQISERRDLKICHSCSCFCQDTHEGICFVCVEEGNEQALSEAEDYRLWRNS